MFLVSVSVNGSHNKLCTGGAHKVESPAVGVPWLQGSSIVQEKGPTIFTVRETGTQQILVLSWA